MDPTTAVDAPAARVQGTAWLTPSRAFLLAASYLLVQAFIRVLISDSAELDESHQLLCVQEWRWGYGSDPPLYTWLQRLTFGLFGAGIPGLALLKNALLFGAFLFTYLAARDISRDERISVVAMLSLFLFPQISWESQRDLTHSVLATTLAAATFSVAVKVCRSRTPLPYALLGLCAGLGTLSKYSYCLFALALAGSALTIPKFRRVVLGKWTLLSVAVFAVIALCHFLWILDSVELFWRRPEQLILKSDRGVIMGRVLGVASILVCAGALAGPIAAIYFLIFRRQCQPSAPAPGSAREFRQWITRTFVAAAGIGLVVVLVLGIELKERWFQPVLVLMAICAAFLVQHRLTPTAERRFALAIGGVALLVLAILPGGVLTVGLTNYVGRLNAPFGALSQQLEAQTGRPAVIAASHRLIGGNLKLFFPQSTVVSPEFEMRCPTNTPWLLVWDASKSAHPPAVLLDLVRRLRGGDAIDAGNLPLAYAEAPLKYSHSKTMKLGFTRLP